MIVKTRTKPLKLLITEAWIRRVPENHPDLERIKDDHKKLQAGYRGEQSLDYHLSYLPDKDYYIFHDLRLPLGDYFFQLDTLIVTPFLILIIEVKNIAGTLLFDTFHKQLIRTINDKEEGFKDPISQVNRQTSQLRKWLEQKQFTVPIENLVIISNPSTIIKTDHAPQTRKLSNQVIHIEYFISYLDKLMQTVQNPCLDSKSIRKLNRLLLQHNTPLVIDTVHEYQIPKSTIIKGVFCPQCHYHPLKRISTKWYCPNCKYSSKTAHLEAIHDYFLLISPTITSREAAEFLNLTSLSVAYRLLSKMNLSSSGSTKGRVYNSPFHPC